MADYFAPMNNALARYASGLQYQDQMQRQGRLDEQDERRNALAEQATMAQIAQMEQERQRQAQLDKAFSGMFQPQRATGTGPMRGVADYQPGRMETTMPTYERALSTLAPFGKEGIELAQKLKGETGGFTLGEGQRRFDASGKEIANVPKPEKPGKQIERTVDLGDKVEYVYTDGTREFKPKKASPNSIIMGNTKTPKMEMDMRKEFTSLPEVKAHVEISSQIQRLEKAMEENAKGGSKVAVDQALITILNKMLDPSSVVRESEYARTPGDLAFLNRMRGKIDKLKTGGAGLTDEDRLAIADMARNFASVSESMYNEQANYYGGLAGRYGYNPENVVRLGGLKRKKTPESGGIKFLGFE